MTMHKRPDVKKMLVVILLAAMLLAPMATYAQEDAATETPAAEQTSAPSGLGTLMLLVGVGALAIVGGAMLARDNIKRG
jgi:hypothetical protein